MNELLGLFYDYTDGCTYSGTSFHGVFTTQEEATKAYIELSESLDDAGFLNYPEDEYHSFRIVPVYTNRLIRFA